MKYNHFNRLGNWPVQIKLVRITRPTFATPTLLLLPIAQLMLWLIFMEILAGKTVCLIGCPKLDDAQTEKNNSNHSFERT